MHTTEDPAAIYTHTAGLVLCHPFLPKCFSLLDYLDENGQFKDEAAFNRAIYLVHSIATGALPSLDLEIPEHLLVLPKILCGMGIEYAIPENITLSELEIATASQLLNAILHNWEKMSQSSVENLRGSFLVRDGRLTIHEHSYSLKVESKAYDILLSFLPWNINVIKLPWMNHTIEVDWNS